MAKPNTIYSNKIFIISGWLLMIGISLLVAALMMIALTLPMSFVNSSAVETWVRQNLLWLQIADELFAFSTPIILAVPLLLYEPFKKQYPIGSSFAVVLAVVFGISAIAGVVLPLGRLVYPINGLPVATHEMTVVTASQVFAGIHLLMLSLALYVIAFSFIAPSRLIMVFSFIVAFLQIVGTYYAGEIFLPLHLGAIVSLLIWAFTMGWYWVNKN